MLVLQVMMFQLFIIFQLALTNGMDQHTETSDSLPYRPISSDRVGTIHLLYKVTILEKTYDLHAHTHYFEEIASLWSTIFLENQLMGKEDRDLHPAIIDNTNPECRDLRTIIMEKIRVVANLLDANIEDPNFHTRTKRAVVVKTALGLLASYMTSKSRSSINGHDLDTDIQKGIIPLGSDLLSFPFGVARAKDVASNRKKLQFLNNQVVKLTEIQGKLIQYANVTKIIIEEMAKLVSKNDAKIMELFDITELNNKKFQRSLYAYICSQRAHI